MNLQELINKTSASHIPAAVLSGAGVLLLVLSIWLVSKFLKKIVMLCALALIAAGVWWHFHPR